MAAGIMPPETGSDFSPCEGGCAHRDCEAIRAIARDICVYCNKPIGYDVRFYQSDKGALQHVHAICEEIAIENSLNR